MGYRKNVKLQKIPAGALVFIGGGAGACLRWVLTGLFPHNTLVATLLINSAGAFCLGYLASLCASHMAQSHRWQVANLSLGTGVLGGFTTYSAFSLHAIQLLQDGAWVSFLLYAMGTLSLGLLACLAGTALAQKTSSRWQGQKR